MSRKQRWLGWLMAAWLAAARPTRRLKSIEFVRHAAQRLGLHFPEKWRDVFRRRWIGPYSPE